MTKIILTCNSFTNKPVSIEEMAIHHPDLPEITDSSEIPDREDAG